MTCSPHSPSDRGVWSVCAPRPSGLLSPKSPRSLPAGKRGNVGPGVASREVPLNARRTATLLAIAATLLVVAALAVVYRDPRVVDEVFRRVGQRAPGPAEAASLAACNEPDVVLLLKIVEQDLDVACPAGFVSSALAHGAKPRWAGWLARAAADPRRSARTRLRAALAVYELSGAPPPSLSVLLEDPGAGDERARLVATWSAAGEAPIWAPPSARDDVRWALWRDGDAANASAATDRLRLEAELGLLTQAEREALVEDALAPVGLGDGWLDAMLERSGRGLPLADLDRPVLHLVDHRIAACSTRSAAGCLRLAADLVEARLDDSADVAPARPRVAVLWEVSYEPRAVEAAARRVEAAAAYVASGDRGERALHLLASVAHPRHRFAAEHARELPLGDPLLALALRRGSPWATAALALALGRAADVPVRVGAVGDGVVIDVDGRRVAVGPCGALIAAPPDPVEAWPEDAVLAQAAIEAAGAALRRGEGPRALRLAVLAESLDPIGAAGVASIVRSRVDVDPLGAVAGALLPVASDPGADALASRRSRAGTWDHARVEWNQAGRPACPSALGP